MNRFYRSFLVLLFACSAFAQNTKPIPDFSHVPEGSSQNELRYQQYDKTPLKFTANPVYVMVPVIVTDKAGKRIGGLKKEDFRILENGKERPIASFEEMKTVASGAALKQAPVAPESNGAREFSNEVKSETAPRLTIIAIDLVNTPFLDQTRARWAILAFLAEHLTPDTLYQLVAIEPSGMRVLHDFTSDTSTLIAALRKVKSQWSVTGDLESMAVKGASTQVGPTMVPDINPTFSVPGGGGGGAILNEEGILASFAKGMGPYLQQRQAEAAAVTLNSFLQIAHRAHSIPGRKSLIWITGGFPFTLNPLTAQVTEGTSFQAYQRTMAAMDDALVAIYPVDARGLLVDQPDASVHEESYQVKVQDKLFSNDTRRMDNLNTMHAFANMTGGKAYVNNNDIKGAIRNASDDASDYYLLSYAVDKNDRKPGYRKIAVKVGDYKVRSRSGYFLTQTTLDSGALANTEIDAALTSPFDLTGLPLRLSVATTPGGNKRKLTFTMVVPPKVAQVDAQDNNHLNLQIAYAVLSATGQDAGHKGVAYNLHLNPTQLEQIQTKGISYGDQVELAAGEYIVRCVVRDNNSGRIGSVAAPVVVQ